MLPGASGTVWTNISRPVEIPEWVRAAAKTNEVRIAKLISSDRSVSVDTIASVDWRSLCDFGSGNPQIKIDWTLIEFVQLADLMHKGGLFHTETSGLFDRGFGSAVFIKYTPSESVMIGEMHRLLCWKAVQKDNHNAVRFFYNRFMDYCASDQEAIHSYIGALEDEMPTSRGIVDFLIQHEFAHFCRNHPECLSEKGARQGGSYEIPFDKIDKNFVDHVGRHKLSYEHFVDLFTKPENKDLAEEVYCDAIGALHMLDFQFDNEELLSPEAVRNLLAYVQVVHTVGWITALECALFDDDTESRVGDFRRIVLMQNVRSHFGTNYTFFSLMLTAILDGDDVVEALVETAAAAMSFMDWLDHTFAHFLEQVISWRFELRDLGASSFWQADEIDTVIDHLRRYPNFDRVDYETAKRISAVLPRGWTVTKD